MAKTIETPDGIRLWTREIGDGPPIVVVHGGPGMSSGSLIGDLHPLAATHRMIYYDQRGGGRSTLPPRRSDLTIEANVRDLESVRRAFRLDRMTILAHSFGAAIAALYAVAHPARVERMVFLAPIPPRRGTFFEEFAAEIRARLSAEDHARSAELLEAIEKRRDVTAACREYWRIQTPPRLARGTDPRVLKSDLVAAPPEAIRVGMLQTNPAVFASLGDWDWTRALATLEVPTLIVHGEEDAIPLAMVSAWTAMPWSRLLPLPATGHFPHAERPDIVFPAIETFLGGE
ncbi:MAG: alpha/beta fold hydrolase [Thermoanaerobaculia bacterium]